MKNNGSTYLFLSSRHFYNSIIHHRNLIFTISFKKQIDSNKINADWVSKASKDIF